MRYALRPSLLRLLPALVLGCRLLQPSLGHADHPVTEPTIEELGLRLARYHTGASDKELGLDSLSQDEIDQFARGSYIVNGAANCWHCHTEKGGAGYMAGGREFNRPFEDVNGHTTVVARNLTPDPDTGLHLAEAEFIEALRTGIDFHDHEHGDEGHSQEDKTAVSHNETSAKTDAEPQRMQVMPWHLYRFMSIEDLKATYAFLRGIPPIHNEVRNTFIAPFPFPPVPFPGDLGDGDALNDPDNVERGLKMLEFFSSGPPADAFVARLQARLAQLPAEDQVKVGRGSYLVNTFGDCNLCHTDGNPDGNFDGGLIPGTIDVNTETYLAGGVDIGPLRDMEEPIYSRNLTPDLDTGLELTEQEFIFSLRFGADFRRALTSLRVTPHFPTEYRFRREDLEAIYAYLRAIPAVSNDVEIVP